MNDRIFVGIDVGLTTGVATIDDHDFAAYCFTVDQHGIYTRGFDGFMREIAGYHVCIEYPEPNVVSNTAALKRVINRWKALLPNAHTVRPGTWKNSAVAQLAVPNNLWRVRLTQHEKDAIGIARWYRAHAAQQEVQDAVRS